MASVNKVFLIGNLGRDPEVRYTTSGQAVANLSVATSESWKDKATGERKEETTWHTVVAWGKDAEFCGQYLAKGATVYVEGRNVTRKYKDRDGNERTAYEVKADRVQGIGRANAQRDDGPSEPEPRQPSGRGRGDAQTGAPMAGDDIPF